MYKSLLLLAKPWNFYYIMENDTTEKSLTYSYVNYSFAIVLLLVVGVIIYFEFRSESVPSNTEIVEIPKLNVLSSEDFEVELNTFTETSSVPPVIIDNSSDTNTESKIITKEESNQIIAEEAYISTNYSDSPTPYIQNSNQSDVLNIKTADNTDIQVSVRSVDDATEKVIMSLEGAIYSLGENRIVISKADNTGFGVININSDTRIQINGKNIGFSSLEVGQKIAVEGLGNLNTSEIDAGVILVSGSIKVIPN
jgi:hypothetical protein